MSGSGMTNSWEKCGRKSLRIAVVPMSIILLIVAGCARSPTAPASSPPPLGWKKFVDPENRYTVYYPPDWTARCCSSLANGASLFKLFPSGADVEGGEDLFRVDFLTEGVDAYATFEEYVDSQVPQGIEREASFRRSSVNLARRQTALMEIRYPEQPSPDSATNYCPCVRREYFLPMGAAVALHVSIDAESPDHWDRWISLTEKILSTLEVSDEQKAP